MIYLKNQKGISLIEVVASIAVISIAFFSIINIFPFSLNNSRAAQNITSAAFLAQAGMEGALSIVYEDLAAGEFESRARLSDDEDSFLYKFERETIVSYVDENLEESLEDAGLKKIEVNVYWQSPIGGGEKSYELKTLMSDE
ncbi:MAG: prepilin-type N-terminal cleavage/methylation domain-containing protein [Patescibacteria group bacterium]|jgi:type II secretory pathway pseudopilin PulG